MERLYRRVARAPVVWFSLFLTVLAFVAFAVLDRGRPLGAPGVVALELAFSADAFRNIIAQWGAAGVQAYRVSTLCFDYWFPVAYALLLASLIALLAARSGRVPARLRLSLFALPFLAALLDWIENTLHLILLRDPHHISTPVVFIASVAAAIKWGLIALSVLVIIFLMLRELTRGHWGTKTR